MSTQLACKLKHSQAWLLRVQTQCPYGSVEALATAAVRLCMPRGGVVGGTWEHTGPPLSWCWTKKSLQIMFTKDKLLRSPNIWQVDSLWMWFPVTSAYQNSLTMTGISRCDFDTSQYCSRFWWSLSFRQPGVTRVFRRCESRGRCT